MHYNLARPPGTKTHRALNGYLVFYYGEYIGAVLRDSNLHRLWAAEDSEGREVAVSLHREEAITALVKHEEDSQARRRH